MSFIRLWSPSSRAAAVSLLSLLATLAPAARAMPVSDPDTDAPAIVSSAPRVPGADLGASEDANQIYSYNVRLAGPSLAEVYRRDKDEAKARGRAPMSQRALRGLLDAMERRQEPVARAVEAAGATIVGRYQVVANGFLVHARPGAVKAIGRLDGVVSVTRAPLHDIDLKDSVPMIGAQRVIDELRYNGAGVTVAIIDTGIDYTHEDLGGSGDAAKYRVNDENLIEPGSFPTAKVVGGYDFAGQRYSPACPQNPPTTTVCTGPMPDEDPLDPPGQGHGSHVSGIVAGIGTATIHNGVAPAAQLVGLKVFGDPINASAATDLVGLALEWATKHNLGLPVPGHAPRSKIDVINMSLGSSFGADWTADCAAVKAAADAGITIVASAGNSGAIPFVVGTPSACRDALSVASSFATGETTLGIHTSWVETDTLRTLDPDAIQATTWLPQLETRGAFTGTLAYYGYACNDESGRPSTPAQDVHERIALIERGPSTPCTFYEKVTNAAKLGAIAVVSYTDNREKTAMGCGAPSPCDISPGIPGVMIDREPGLLLRETALKGIEVTVVLDPNYRIGLDYLADTISGFSSRGPGRVDNALKPQITAPGSNIRSVGAGTGTGARDLSGTSMSSPTVAGVAALLWQRNHSERLAMSAADIAALAMNYSTPVIKIGRNTTGPVGGIARQGAGRTDVWRSATGNTLARTEDGFAALGFGNLYVEQATARVSRRVSVRNLSTAAKTYRPSSRFIFPDDEAKGISFSFAPATLTVPAHQTGELEVTLVADAAALRSWPNRVPNWVTDEAFLAQYEMDGQVLLTEVDDKGTAVAGGDEVGMPFYVVPRRRACVSTETSAPFNLVATDEPVTQTWTNPCGMDGLVQPTVAALFDAPESATDPSFLPKVDIDTIGVRWGQDPLTTTKSTMLEFQLHTAGGRSIPIDTAITIYVDLDSDGDFERAISYRPAGAALAYTVAQAPVITNTLAVNLAATSPISYPLAFDLGETTTILRANAEVLGLDFSTGRAKFGFAVRQSDSRIEMPATRTYPGFDDAPNGLKATASPSYVVDQAKLGCLQIVGPGGKTYGAYGDALTVPAGGSVSASLKYTCALPSGGEVAVLSAFPLNAAGPDERQVRWGRFGKVQIYLPSAEQP